MTQHCPHCGEPLDRRAARWRVRVRLYLEGNPRPSADTDPELPDDAPGTTVIAGLPGVAEHVADLARDFHGDAELIGLEMPTLRQRLKSLRPTLSRRGGNGVWRIPYMVKGPNRQLSAVARVDVIRE
jgi:hypothetical protein